VEDRGGEDGECMRAENGGRKECVIEISGSKTENQQLTGAPITRGCARQHVGGRCQPTERGDGGCDCFFVHGQPGSETGQRNANRKMRIMHDRTKVRM